MGNEKSNFILLIIVAVITLLVAVAGATFAYFGATVKGKGESTTIEVTSGTLSIDFSDNSRIDNVGATTGQVIVSKNFIVKGIVTGSNNLDYVVNLNIIENTYPEGTLKYTISLVNEINNGIPMSAIVTPVDIGGNDVIKLGSGTFIGPVTNDALHSYFLTITYDGPGEIDKVFNGNITINQKTN